MYLTHEIVTGAKIKDEIINILTSNQNLQVEEILAVYILLPISKIEIILKL